MNFFDRNMELIKEHHNYLYKDLIIEDKAYTNRLDHIESISARDGEKALVITYRGSIYRLNSIYRPLEEAKRWSEQFTFHNINTVVSMFGIGNGMFARAILNRMEDNHILILYEPSYDIFSHTLRNYDLSDILLNDRVVIVVEGVNDFDFHWTVQGVINITNIKSQVQCVYPNYDMLFEESYKIFLTEIKNSMTTSKVEINTTIKLSEKYIENLFKNLIYLINSSTVSELKKTLPTDLPAIVVAAGPSLKENIEELKKAKGKAVIFACDRVLDFLLDSGVEPDFVITIDPMKLREHFSLRNDVSIPLICTIVANNEILRNHIGQKIFCTSNAFADEIYNLVNKKATNVTISGSVAIVAYSTCVDLGFKRIILVGQDLAYSGDVSHADGTVDKQESRKIVMLEGIDGNMIKSRYDWKEFVIRYQDLITFNPDVEVIDAKQRGARIKGTKVMPLKDALAAYCSDEDSRGNKGFEIEAIFKKEDAGKILEYLKNYMTIIKRLTEEAESAVRNCNNIIQGYSKGLSDKKLNEGLKKLAKINSFIYEQSIYSLMDPYIVAKTANQISEILNVSEDEDEYNRTTFEKSKIIYQAVIDACDLIKQYMKEAIDLFEMNNLTEGEHRVRK